MTDSTVPRLSSLVDRLLSEDLPPFHQLYADDQAVLVLDSSAIVQPAPAGSTDRRAFLARASTLSLAIPGVGAALAACAPAGDADKAAAIRDSAGSRVVPLDNSNSRLDSAVLREEHHEGTSATAAATAGASQTAFRRFDPALPPLAPGNRLALNWHAREVPVRISKDTVVAAWTFEGDIPGPIVHCRVGDTVDFTLTNDVDIPHSMDFHAAQIDPKHAFRSVTKGQSVQFSFTPRFAGAFMYHCGTAPVLMHIGSGMYGAIVVSPREPLPPAKEFVIVQSEFYLAEAVNGVRAFDYAKMTAMLPDFVAFNGRPNQYMDAPIRVKVGDRVRFWVVSAGPTHPSHFHVVGEQFDTVYLGAPPGTPIRGVQTFTVPAGGGMVFELVCDVPGEFPFVNHGFGHGQKGAIGILVVEP
ncbi:multicopper oxidase domain-containing protein [Gemmatimonas sp.]|uniref:multicopper oxidase domain-containing protein n=1 Tax=Gemmatimonas sp. TaxID=1962908 RepID=UPI00286D9879|nr:multicopper oxidase domain-containing protein [Gemmatimonas sp.]